MTFAPNAAVSRERSPERGPLEFVLPLRLSGV
jgi:hypothetical protein